MGWANKKKKYIVIAVGLLFFILLGFWLRRLKNAELNDFKVVLKAKVKHDDEFQFFYVENPDESFDSKKSVKTSVKGKESFQEISFVVPNLKSLEKIRLDIGSFPNQGTIAIEGIYFETEGYEIDYGISSFKRLFKGNNYIKESGENGLYQGLSAKKNGKEFFDPYFVSRSSSKELQRLKTQPLTNYPFFIAAFFTLVLVLFALYNLDLIGLTKEFVLIAVFMSLLFLPLLQSSFLFVDPAKNMEKRTLAKKPEFSFSKGFTKNFENYFNDNFGFRNYLINFGGGYRTRFFRSSMHPELVKFGKEDWLYYNRIDGKIFKSYTRTNLISADTLERIVSKWEKNRIKYESKGAKYFLTFWPNKHTIYPEYLPRTMQMQIKDTLSRVDQIIKYLNKRNATVTLFDPRPFLLEGKKEHQLYHKFDTHWNDYGAFLGYQAFFKEIGIQPKGLDDFEVKWEDFKEGELIQMLGVKNKGSFVEKAPSFKLKENQNQIEFLSTKGFPSQTKRTRNKNCGNKLKVLVFRDSYTTKLIQFISLHFYEVTYIWGHGEKYVDIIKPDIVIEGYVERGTGQKIQ